MAAAVLAVVLVGAALVYYYWYSPGNNNNNNALASLMVRETSAMFRGMGCQIDAANEGDEKQIVRCPQPVADGNLGTQFTVGEAARVFIKQLNEEPQAPPPQPQPQPQTNYSQYSPSAPPQAQAQAQAQPTALAPLLSDIPSQIDGPGLGRVTFDAAMTNQDHETPPQHSTKPRLDVDRLMEEREQSLNC